MRKLLAHNRGGARVSAGLADLGAPCLPKNLVLNLRSFRVAASGGTGKATASSLAATAGHDRISGLLVEAHHLELIEAARRNAASTSKSTSAASGEL